MTPETLATVQKAIEYILLLGGGTILREGYDWWRNRKKAKLELKTGEQQLNNTTLEMSDDMIKDWLDVANRANKELIYIRRYTLKLENYLDIAMTLIFKAVEMLKTGIIHSGEKFAQEAQVLKEQVEKEVARYTENEENNNHRN